MSKLFAVALSIGVASLIAMGVHDSNTSFTKVATSSSGVCGLNADGELYCKGPDAATLNADFMFTQVDIPEESGVVEEFDMSEAGACAKTSKGDAFCWGALDIKGKALPEGEVVKIASNVRHLAVGGKDVCLIDAITPWELKCTGSTMAARTDDSAATSQPTDKFQPVSVMTSLMKTPLTRVMMSEGNICVSTEVENSPQGLLLCSGNNEDGQLLPGFASKLKLPSVAVGNVPKEVGTVVRSVGLMEKVVESLIGEPATKAPADLVRPVFDKGSLQFTLKDNVLCGKGVKSSELYCQGGVGEFASNAAKGAPVKQYAQSKDTLCVIDMKDALQCATSTQPVFYTVREEGEMDEATQLSIIGTQAVVLDDDGDLSYIELTK